MVRDGRRMSIGEYLQLERTSDVRHEYVNGEAFAMAGGSPLHSAVCMNVGAALHAALRGGPCRVFQSDLRVHVESTGMFTYPDATVVCGDVLRAKADPHSVINPRLVVEVLSPTTEGHDRAAKFKHYQSIATLEEYVLVDPADRRVEVYRRAHDLPKVQWLLSMHTEGQVELVEKRISVEEIFAQLDGLAD